MSPCPSIASEASAAFRFSFFAKARELLCGLAEAQGGGIATVKPEGQKPKTPKTVKTPPLFNATQDAPSCPSHEHPRKNETTEKVKRPPFSTVPGTRPRNLHAKPGHSHGTPPPQHISPASCSHTTPPFSLSATWRHPSGPNTHSNQPHTKKGQHRQQVRDPTATMTPTLPSKHPPCTDPPRTRRTSSGSTLDDRQEPTPHISQKQPTQVKTPPPFRRDPQPAHATFVWRPLFPALQTNTQEKTDKQKKTPKKGQTPPLFDATRDLPTQPSSYARSFLPFTGT